MTTIYLISKVENINIKLSSFTDRIAVREVIPLLAYNDYEEALKFQREINEKQGSDTISFELQFINLI